MEKRWSTKPGGIHTEQDECAANDMEGRQGREKPHQREQRRQRDCSVQNGREEHYLQIIPIIVRKMLLLKMKMPWLRQHENELFTNHQPGLGSPVTDAFGGRREGIRVLSIVIMAIQTYWEMAPLRVLKHRTDELGPGATAPLGRKTSAFLTRVCDCPNYNKNSFCILKGSC